MSSHGREMVRVASVRSKSPANRTPACMKAASSMNPQAFGVHGGKPVGSPLVLHGTMTEDSGWA